MRRSPHLGALAAALALALAGTVVLAGCTTAPTPASTPDPTAESEPPAAASESPAPEPIATPPADDPAERTTWLIDAEGIGPITLGMPIDDAVAMFPGYRVETCENPAVRLASPGDTFTYTAFTLVADAQGSLVEVTTGLEGPATASGLGVGSSSNEVAAVHPDASYSQARTDLYTAAQDPGWITFATERKDAGDAPIATVSVVAGGLPSTETCD